VVARRQILDLGGSAGDIRRMRRRRELTTVHDGVYVDHTGPLTRRQRQWAAVLACWPAALHRRSALEAHGMTRDRPLHATDQPVVVAVDASRTPGPRRGVRVERVADLDRWVLDRRSPPVTTVEFALLKEASSRTETHAIAVLADGCRQGLTTAGRLVETLEQLPRLKNRRHLLAVLEDVASGAHSLLEQRYLSWIERAHGLPTGERQVRVVGPERICYRDVRYQHQATLVELDGRFGHRDAEDRWADLDRDVSAAVDGEITIRLGWLQVTQPCRVAGALGVILQTRGWTGAPWPCGPECLIADAVGSGSPGDSDPTRRPRGA
jgi:hypothetical protein